METDGPRLNEVDDVPVKSQLVPTYDWSDPSLERGAAARGRMHR